MENFKYSCINGAYHTYSCCETCWNKHPLNTEGEMFLHSAKYFEVVKQNFIQNAMEHGFNQQQAVFLYDRGNATLFFLKDHVFNT